MSDVERGVAIEYVREIAEAVWEDEPTEAELDVTRRILNEATITEWGVRRGRVLYWTGGSQAMAEMHAGGAHGFVVVRQVGSWRDHPTPAPTGAGESGEVGA